MNRREFLKFSSCGLTMVAVGSTMPLLMRGNPAFAQLSSSSRLELDMVEVEAEMVDGVRVAMWAFKIDDSSSLGSSDLIAQPRIPGPAFFVLEGERVRLRIRNRIPNGGPHAFAIPGLVDSGPIPQGERSDLEFAAPRAGTYLYYDNLNAPVNRVMGLHGVLVVLPDPIGNNTPYSDPTPNVQRLFDDLGTTAHFPGHPWDHSRNTIWVFSVVDPDKNALAAASGSGINPATFLGGYLPQYFTINGKSGFFAAQHHGHHGDDNGDDDHSHEDPLERFTFDTQANISISGRIGQPTLIRNVNAGLMWHSPHIHGNHLYMIRENGRIMNDLIYLDTWTTPPLFTVDLLHPFIRPPDIPAGRQVVDPDGNPVGRPAWPPVQENFPLFFPMHDHNEISQTAAGGNYPHGMVTHWQIDGDIDPNGAVIHFDRADYRVRSGQIVVEGRISTVGIMLHIHAGGHEGPEIGHAHVDDFGRWAFRGRSLKALAERRVTVVFHDPEDPEVIHASRTVPLRLR